MRKAKTRDDEERFGNPLTGGCYKCGNRLEVIVCSISIFYCENCGTIETEKEIITPDVHLSYKPQDGYTFVPQCKDCGANDIHFIRVKDFKDPHYLKMTPKNSKRLMEVLAQEPDIEPDIELGPAEPYDMLEFTDIIPQEEKEGE